MDLRRQSLSESQSSVTNPSININSSENLYQSTWNQNGTHEPVLSNAFIQEAKCAEPDNLHNSITNSDQQNVLEKDQKLPILGHSGRCDSNEILARSFEDLSIGSLRDDKTQEKSDLGTNVPTMPGMPDFSDMPDLSGMWMLPPTNAMMSHFLRHPRTPTPPTAQQIITKAVGKCY